MRLALFEICATACSVSLDKVLHILTEPHVFKLPLLRPCFIGGLVYQGQVVPLLSRGDAEGQDDIASSSPAFVLICEAEYGLIGVPADRIVRITKAGDVDSEVFSECDTQAKSCKISGRDYLLLDLNRVLEDPAFAMSRLKD